MNILYLHHQTKTKNMKTQEGYTVEKVSDYNVVTSIYMGTVYNDDIRENGFSGVVKDPNLDDRFICDEFCIWNAKGDLVYINNEWGQFKHYKLHLNP